MTKSKVGRKRSHVKERTKEERWRRCEEAARIIAIEEAILQASDRIELMSRTELDRFRLWRFNLMAEKDMLQRRVDANAIARRQRRENG